ncbi:insulinase family protein [Altererythrobacter soli]|uniref:Insulinase family protein n=1 Tax=Croceibacterium soli TaxID=1739690 RepID=A0A6I4UUL2_9SPHN|nr:insulinase family protein [Croceibacterium soli]MXP42612.1 insulinase family protein [Croceibacterium soli]
MVSPLYALRVLAPLVLLVPLPLAAQQAAAPSAPAATAGPRYAQPDDPWLFRGTDIPPDREWLFGEMPNGLRYAVRRNSVPPGQVSIRIRIDAGSLHERDNERGFAHLIEHLSFRESKYLSNGQAIPTWQRLGASFGSDTNAETSPTHTVYKLDLPNAQRASLEETMKLLSGMIREPALSEANLKAEVPIVLAERRERTGADMRVATATRETLFAGQLLADRAPIGTVETLQGATPKAVRAFHDRWYRPENTVIVAAGDADPAYLAALIEQHFADWKVAGEPTQAPDFGKPVAPPGADPEMPVGETRVVVEPGQPRGFNYAYLRPYVQVVDNLEYNRGKLIDAVGEAIINRRLEAKARSGGSYLYAAVQTDDISRSTSGTFVAFAPLSADWRAALADVRSVIADALAEPPTQEEIDRELAEFDVIFANQVEQTVVQAGSKLADDLVQAVDIREAVASPALFLDVFRGMKDRFTPEAVFQHTQRLFKGTVVRALYLTPVTGEASAADVAAALREPPKADGSSRIAAQDISFAELPPVGTPTAPVSRRPIGIFDIEQLDYANGVRALVWNSGNEPGRVTVRVRFGSGWRAFSGDEGVYAKLGQMALVGSGVGPLGQEELDRITTGRKVGFNFEIKDGAFVFQGLTRQADLADQLYLFAAKLATPRWDANPLERARASARLAYDSYGRNPNGVLGRDLEWLLNNRDPRFATPGPEQLAAVTPERFRAIWEPLLKQGPVEVEVFGDIDTEAAVQALNRTFGALPQRQAIPAEALARTPSFPSVNGQPVVLRHSGEPEQAAAAIAWPTGGGSAQLPESRKLEVLAEIFSNRLLDAVRENAGASYAPQVVSEWPLDVNSGGRFLALAQIPPAQVPQFFVEADRIAAELAATGPTPDELERATEPLRQLLVRLQTGHTFWLNQLEGATTDPNRLAQLPSLMSDYTRPTTEEMGALAAKYLQPGKAFRLQVLPEKAAR